MQKKISLDDKEVAYTLRVSSRARQMRLTVSIDNGLVVTLPHFMSFSRAERFIEEKARWILRTIARFNALPRGLVIPAKRGDYARHKEAARTLALARLAHFNAFYGFRYRSVSIRNQKTRWGSCSKSGGLSFNYKIALLPAPLADYVVLHELCHLGEFSHSGKFWALMARVMPDYRERKQELRRVRFS
ncbi:MAG TPA: SprT family zinc-dependent metalloprotease [Candidatus Paceibacterota bacterium]|nr:SprT family zinc-dependent metalloprotease [Candidatus Paceibacterota bacterium]